MDMTTRLEPSFNAHKSTLTGTDTADTEAFITS